MPNSPYFLNVGSTSPPSYSTALCSLPNPFPTFHLRRYLFFPSSNGPLTKLIGTIFELVCVGLPNAPLVILQSPAGMTGLTKHPFPQLLHFSTAQSSHINHHYLKQKYNQQMYLNVNHTPLQFLNSGAHLPPSIQPLSYMRKMKLKWKRMTLHVSSTIKTLSAEFRVRHCQKLGDDIPPHIHCNMFARVSLGAQYRERCNHSARGEAHEQVKTIFIWHYFRETREYHYIPPNTPLKFYLRAWYSISSWIEQELDELEQFLVHSIKTWTVCAEIVLEIRSEIYESIMIVPFTS